MHGYAVNGEVDVFQSHRWRLTFDEFTIKCGLEEIESGSREVLMNDERVLFGSFVHDKGDHRLIGPIQKVSLIVVFRH